MKTKITVTQGHETKAYKNNINRQCRVLQSECADIAPDDVGRIVEVVGQNGYGVEFTRGFSVLGKLTEKTEIVYAEAKYIKLL